MYKQRLKVLTVLEHKTLMSNLSFVCLQHIRFQFCGQHCIQFYRKSEYACGVYLLRSINYVPLHPFPAYYIHTTCLCEKLRISYINFVMWTCAFFIRLNHNNSTANKISALPINNYDLFGQASSPTYSFFFVAITIVGTVLDILNC